MKQAEAKEADAKASSCTQIGCGSFLALGTIGAIGSGQLLLALVMGLFAFMLLSAFSRSRGGSGT